MSPDDVPFGGAKETLTSGAKRAYLQLTDTVGRGHATLHIGVLVQPYRTNSGNVRGLTTGDVAQILEDKYHLFETFYLAHETGIGNDLLESLEGSMESALMGRAVDPWGSAMQSIQQRFRDFINKQEAERVGIPGTPTKAALMGVSHRRKHPYKKSNPRRPSFRDTGLLVASGRAWME